MQTVSGKSCHENNENINKAVANFTERLTAYMDAWLPTVDLWSRLASAVGITLATFKFCIMTSTITNQLFSEPPTDYW